MKWHQIKIWGDGRQTRSFMYIDDCLLGTKLIMDSSIDFPINLGSAEMVSINQLVDIAEEIAGVKLERSYDVDAPKRGTGPVERQHPDQARARLGAVIRLHNGLEKTYAWIYEQMAGRLPSHA